MIKIQDKHLKEFGYNQVMEEYVIIRDIAQSTLKCLNLLNRDGYSYSTKRDIQGVESDKVIITVYTIKGFFADDIQYLEPEINREIKSFQTKANISDNKIIIDLD